MRALVTGNFDGCHLGHQELFRVLRLAAAERGLEPVVLSFEPHTRHVLKGPGEPQLLTPTEEKRDFIESLGLKFRTLPFCKEMAAVDFRHFVERIILNEYKTCLWVFGHDHRFGQGGEGTLEAIRLAFPAIETLAVGPVHVHGRTVSSSAIRNDLRDGLLAHAAGLLGRSYRLRGLVVAGERRGRTLGFPTANLELPPHKLLPALGVYAGWAKVDGDCWPCVVNIGVRPSFGGRPVCVEVHLLDFSGDLYGKLLEIKLDLRLRAEMRFPDVPALKAQIDKDVREARRALTDCIESTRHGHTP